MKSSTKYMVGVVLVLSFLLSLLIFYNSISAQTILEKEILNDNTIRIQNSLKEPLLDVQLIENTNQCLVDCYTILKFHPYQTITFPKTPNDDFRWDFLKATPQMLGLKSYRFQVLENVSYEVSTPIFSNQSHDCINNVTRTHEICWEDVQTGVTEETEYRDEYRDFDFLGKNLEPGKDYYIKLIGEKYPVLGENNVDWVPTLMGIQIREWQWWNSTWQKRLRINITNTGQLQPKIIFNSSVVTLSDFQPNGADIRIVDNNDLSELNFWLQDDLVNTAGNSYIWVNVNSNSSIIMYYKNSSAVSTKSDIEKVAVDGIGDNFNSWNSTKWGTVWSCSLGISNSNLVMNTSTNEKSCGVISKVPLRYTNVTIIIRFNETINPSNRASELPNWRINGATWSQGYSGFRGYWDVSPYPPALFVLNSGWKSLFTYNSSGLVSLNGTVQVFQNNTYIRGIANTTQAVGDSGWIRESNFTTGGNVTMYKYVVTANQDVTRVDWIAAFNYSQQLTYSFNQVETETFTPATESEGDTAIENGIKNSLGTNATIYTDQQIYIRYLNESQLQGQFDKVTVYGNQTWAFNYVTSGESYTNMYNLNTTVYVWEKDNLTAQNITSQVSTLINATKV